MRIARPSPTMFAVIALLIGGGASLGAIASSFTTATLKPVAAMRAPMTETAIVGGVDQAAAAKGWARTAFDGGLRQCPAMNPEFLTACEAEMKALAARPAFSHGPLRITEVAEAEPEQAAYQPANYEPDPSATEPEPGDDPVAPQP